MAQSGNFLGTGSLDRINQRLKEDGVRVRVLAKGPSFYLRATFPAKSGDGKQQYKLKLPETDLQAVDLKARELGQQLRAETFNWELWEPKPEERITCADFRTAGLKLFKSKNLAASGWDKKWRPALNKLPADSVPCSDALLIAVVEKMPEGSAGRRDQGNVLSQIAHSLKMDGAAIREAGKGYTATKVEKRDIPSDKLIEETFELIKLPHWRWMFGMIATYGLRPHEIAECELDRDGFCHIADDTKTGFHIAWPVHKHWINDFKLRKEHRPSQSKDDVAHAANDYLHKRGRVPFPLYNLRHAYAIRLFNKNIPSSIGAKVMGHSEEIHRDTYQRWYDAKEIMGLADQYDL